MIEGIAGAVMLAFALFLLDAEGAAQVEIHPDGEHGKRFDIAGWLEAQTFMRTRTIGSATYGGEYVRADGKSVIVDPKSGLGDVVAEVAGQVVIAECKGGVINTTHPGQKSRLYSGLCETVRMLMAKPEAGRELSTWCDPARKAARPVAHQTVKLSP